MNRTARVLSEVLAPWVIVLLLPSAVAWQTTRSAPLALGWGLWVALTSSLLPMAVIVRGARRGRWDGHHVRNREGRLIPFLVLLASSATGLAVLVLASAPAALIALDVAMIACLVVTGLITTRWKVSMHTAVAGGAVVILAIAVGPVLWWLAPLVAAIGWSRVRLGDHTPAQVAVGALTGAAVGGGFFALF